MTLKLSNKLIPKLITALSLTVASSTVISANSAEAFTLKISPEYGSTENTGATAEVDFNFAQDGNDVLLNLDIFNTTDGTAGNGATTSTLVGVGFDLPEIIKSYTYNSQNSDFTKLYSDARLEPYGSFDIGIRSKGSGGFIGGNPQGGLTAGQSTSVQYRFTGNNLTTTEVENAFQQGFSATYLRAAGRFQEVDGNGSDKVFASLLQSNVNYKGEVDIPEPTTTAALGLVSLGAFAFLKRSKKAN
ncbi:MAG: PEP-CTERM sorting domain-containing protein [Halothece sp.]